MLTGNGNNKEQLRTRGVPGCRQPLIQLPCSQRPTQGEGAPCPPGFLAAPSLPRGRTASPASLPQEDRAGAAQLVPGHTSLRKPCHEGWFEDNFRFML